MFGCAALRCIKAMHGIMSVQVAAFPLYVTYKYLNRFYETPRWTSWRIFRMLLLMVVNDYLYGLADSINLSITKRFGLKLCGRTGPPTPGSIR